MLVLHALQPRSLLGSSQERLGLLGEREEPLRVLATDRVGVVRGREALAANSPIVQHPEPFAGPPHKVLSTSDCSLSTSASAISSATSSVEPPAKTDSRLNSWKGCCGLRPLVTAAAAARLHRA